MNAIRVRVGLEPGAASAAPGAAGATRAGPDRVPPPGEFSPAR